ncbi:MAG: hypothetical protein DLM61_12840 [Pseudonocardiales bacterium]|nr:MAG: hypothetical protein DLM61_12840 [Pseudonocardiales bacterium]
MTEEDRLMGVKVSGGSFSVLGIGINWERAPGDERIARAVIIFLEDRRLLFGSRHIEDQAHCVSSALECRTFFTKEIAEAEPGKPLETTLKSMRAAFRQFVERGGPHGRNFQYHRSMSEADPFSLALGDLRTQVGEQLARIAWRYDIEIDDELARILPPEDDGTDPSWMVGFDRD